MSTWTPGGGLPRSVRLAWGLTDHGSRGPKRGLSLDQVLDAAVAVADAEGLAGLSMSNVAKRLGFTTMSLYRYVDSKEQLVELAWDRAIGPPPQFPETGEWRARLERWAVAEYQAIRARRWCTQLPIRTAPYWPNNMRWLDAALGTLSGTDLDEPTKLQVVLTVSLYVLGRARLSWELELATQNDEMDYADVMPRLLDPERFPRVLAAVEGGAFGPDDTPDDPAENAEWHITDFRFGLDRLLDGFDVFIRQIGEES